MATPHDIASGWLSRFSSAIESHNVESVTACFCSDGWFRDVLVFTWDNRTLEGTDKISKYLADALPATQISDFKLTVCPGLVAEHGPISPWATGVSSGFAFSTPLFAGRGYFRIQLVDGEWKAFTVSMMLDELKGHEENGPEEGVYDGHTSPWSDVWLARRRKIEQDPYVLVIGAGQTGLNLASRFKQLDIPTLVVEVNARIGDNWRKRYPTLTLHTIKNQHTMLYQPYPSTWPVYTPRDKLADWLEQYATSQDLVVWTETKLLPKPQYDPATKRWAVSVNRKGVVYQLHPAHIVIATGTLGAPFVPDNIQDMEKFKGQILHSTSYNGGSEFAGKRVIVVGTGNTSADLCQDLCTQGAAAITMVQRSATAVVKASTIRFLLEMNFPSEIPVDISDFKFFSTPMPLIKRMLASTAEENWEREKDIHEGLKQAGLKLHMGSDGSGVFPLVFERGGGYWLDVGAAKLIGSGKIKIKGGEITKFQEHSVVFQDGSSLEADVVIFATGYRNIRESNEALFGAEAISKTRPVWGLDTEGEIRGCYRPTGHPGLWYAAGDFQNSRFSSKHLGLQIKARQLGYCE